MEILWHRQAREDLQAIRLFYGEIDPAIAHKLLAAIFETARRLAKFPALGREGRVKGTRELPVPHTRFIISYMAKDGRPVVLAVYHAFREWPTIWLMAAVRERLEGDRFIPHEDIERYLKARIRGENPDPPKPGAPESP